MLEKLRLVKRYLLVVIVTNKTMACLKILFNETSYHIETSQLNGIANHLSDFKFLMKGIFEHATSRAHTQKTINIPREKVLSLICTNFSKNLF